MTVVARILMLVACMPLLQPPGVCVCKAGGVDGPSPVQESVEVQPQGHSAGNRTGCTCSECAPVVKGRTAATLTPSSPPASPSPADDHLPGCPASPGADSLKWVDPSPHLVTVLALPVLVTLTITEPVLTVQPVVPASARWSSSPPLYLSHCSLVI